MRQFAFNSILALTVLTPQIIKGQTPDRIGPASKIEGEYNLYRFDEPNGGVVTKLKITAVSDKKILVRGVGQDWIADGEVIENKGYYKWKFDDGKEGRTEITIRSDGTIKGHVAGAGIDWIYLAHPSKSNQSR